MAKDVEVKPPETVKQRCGVVMPISAIDACSEKHWADVKDILFDSIQNAGFEPNLVSDADDVGIIQKRIIQNLHDNPIVVCDVSCKNPNVMFELGMRLAFDKPTIIVKDEPTSYSFDTGQIEHLGYPRDLRYARIIDFKKLLAEKIKSTHEKASNDPNYTTFLKHFGKFSVAKLDTAHVSKEDYIIEEMRELRQILLRSNNPRDFAIPSRSTRVPKELDSRIRVAIAKAAADMGGGFSIPDGEEELISRLEVTLPASKYFANREELREAVRRILYN